MIVLEDSKMKSADAGALFSKATHSADTAADTRRGFLRTAAAGALLPLGLRAAAKRPNIVVILADDMGFSDIGCFGSEIETPNIDRLANEGIRFTNFYNNARCCPSRCSLLTGLYPQQGGIGHMTADYHLPGYRGELNKNCVTIAEALRLAAYHTLMTGKWHVSPFTEAYRYDWPLQRGFEHHFGTIAGAGSYFDPFSLQRDNEPVKPGRGFYYTDAIGDQTASFITEYAGKSDPFFLYTAFTAPHWPLEALPQEIVKYKDRYRAGWDQLRAERHGRQIRSGLVKEHWPLTPRDERVPPWEDAPNKEWEVRRMAVYAAQVDRLDQNIGKLTAALEKSGAAENTLVLFLSDNGACAEILSKGMKSVIVPRETADGKPMRAGNDPTILPGEADTYASYGIGWANASNTPFRLYKHWVHEGGIATPLLARWPRAVGRPNSATDRPGHITDLMATCLDIAQAGYPREHNGERITPTEGRSLLPLIRGKKSAGREEICWEHEGNRAIRRGKWKLVSRYPDRWELYDLEADRTEMRNRISSEPARAKDMETRWSRWADRVGVVPWKQLDQIKRDG